MKFDWLAPFLVLLLVILILSAVIVSCGEIVEEEKETDATETVAVTETVAETEETEPPQTDLLAVINEQLDLLTADLEALLRKIPEGFTEHDIIAAHPEAFAAITDLGADAVPYLMEIGEEYWTSYQNYRLDSGLAYARCILAYAAAQEIDGASFNRVFASPVGGYLLYQSPSVLWGMGDSAEGILYDLHLLDADGNLLAQTAGCSSLAYIDWTADGRYAVVSDRLWDERQLSTTVAFDTVRGTAVNVVARTVFDAAAAAYGQQFRYYDTRYQGYTDDGYLRIWFGMGMADDSLITGYYDYDAVTGAVMATESAPFDPAADNYDTARRMDVHEVGSSFAYLMTDATIHRLEVKVGEDWSRTLYINGALALDGFLYLNDIRAVDDYHLAVVTGGTDINSEHLYLFDRAGNRLFDTYYLTDKGMVFRGIKAVEDGRILLNGARGYHGPTLVAPTQEQITAGDYADLLYTDPISDTISGGALERDNVGEVPLYRGYISADLNPDLIFEGVYALPYFGDGKFGQIELVEITQTLGDVLDELYPVNEIPEELDIAEAVAYYLDTLVKDTRSNYTENVIISQNPDAFNALVSLGTDAIPYLQTAAKDMPAMIVDDVGMKRLQRASVAMMAAYMIDPALYDLKVISPDGTTAATAKVGSFMGLDLAGTWTTAYDGIVITDAVTGTEISRTPFAQRLINLQLEWSADGRYVVYRHGIGGQHGYVTGGLFDTALDKMQFFPTNEAFLAVLCPMVTELLDVTASDVEGISHTISSWTEDGDIMIKFDFRVGTVMGVTGTYRFDPETGEFFDIHAHINHFNTQ